MEAHSRALINMSFLWFYDTFTECLDIPKKRLCATRTHAYLLKENESSSRNGRGKLRKSIKGESTTQTHSECFINARKNKRVDKYLPYAEDAFLTALLCIHSFIRLL